MEKESLGHRWSWVILPKLLRLFGSIAPQDFFKCYCWSSNILNLIVPDESDYRNVSRALTLISTFYYSCSTCDTHRVILIKKKKLWIVIRIFYNVCFVDRCFSFWNFSFGHCVVCSSSIYGFCLPLCHLQTRLSVNRNHRILERVTWNRLYFGPYIAMEATT